MRRYDGHSVDNPLLTLLADVTVASPLSIAFGCVQRDERAQLAVDDLLQQVMHARG